VTSRAVLLLVPAVLLAAAPSYAADHITGTSADDHLTGTSGRDVIAGGRGDDVLLGRDGNDDLDGSSGDDRLSGGRGRDFLAAYVGSDLLKGGAGNDLAALGAGSAGGSRLRLGPGHDEVLVQDNGRPDLIDCGPGRDLAEWVTTRDPADRYVGCEVVREYLGY
jgi:Ca2+-binding RTX toxin-like protein